MVELEEKTAKTGQEEVVATEVVVTGEELKAYRERRQVEVEGKEENETEVEGVVRGEEGDAEEKKLDEEVVSVKTEKVGSDQGTEIIGEEEGGNAEEAEGDCIEITEEVARETWTIEKGTAERTERRARRFSRRLAGILVSDEGLYEEDNVEKMEADQTDQEGEEEEEDAPLKGRLRSSRATDQVATSAEGPEDSSSTAHSSASIPPTPENKLIDETPEEEIKDTGDDETIPEARDEARTGDEARYRRERKRKGKMLAKQVQKKARKTNPTVTIQEPIYKCRSDGSQVKKK